MGEVGSGSGAGVAGLDIEKRPDNARLFGGLVQHYVLSKKDYFRKPGWSSPLRGSGFF